MSVYHWHTVPSEAKKRLSDPWYWSYKISSNLSVPGSELGSSEEQIIFLTTEPPFQSPRD